MNTLIYKGHFEGIAEACALGWAASDRGAALKVTLYIDGRKVVGAYTDPNDGDRFCIEVPEDYRDGYDHSFEVRFDAIDMALNDKATEAKIAFKTLADPEKALAKIRPHPEELEQAMAVADMDLPLENAPKAEEFRPEDLKIEDQKVEEPALPKEKSVKNERQISVIVTIFNAPKETRACLESVIATTPEEVGLILINDASPDTSIRALVDSYGTRKNCLIVHHETNQGYTRSVNAALELAGDDDVILLNSDTVVSPLWWQSLRLCAYSKPNVATVTALSNNAGAFSAPVYGQANEIPPKINFASISRKVRHESPGLCPEVPIGNGFCLYIRREAIDSVGKFDADAFPEGYGEENDFCLRAADKGFCHLIDDRTYIYHKRSASFAERKEALMAAGHRVILDRYQDYESRIEVYRTGADMIRTRESVAAAFETLKATKKAPTARVGLIVCEPHLKSYLGRLEEIWVFVEKGASIAIFYAGPRGLEAVETVQSDNDHLETLGKCLIRYAIESLIIDPHGAHPMPLKRMAQKLGLTTQAV